MYLVSPSGTILVPNLIICCTPCLTTTPISSSFSEGRGPRSALTAMAAPSTAPAAANGQRFLILFDFDETMIAENSDDAVVRAAPGQRLPDWLVAAYREGHYNEHMQRVLSHLAQQGVGEDAIRAALEKIPPHLNVFWSSCPLWILPLFFVGVRGHFLLFFY